MWNLAPQNKSSPQQKMKKKISLIQGARFHIFTRELDEAVLIFLVGQIWPTKIKCPLNGEGGEGLVKG